MKKIIFIIILFSFVSAKTNNTESSSPVITSFLELENIINLGDINLDLHRCIIYIVSIVVLVQYLTDGFVVKDVEKNILKHLII